MRFSGFDTYLPRLTAYVLVNVVAAVADSCMCSTPVSSRRRASDFGKHNALVAALMGACGFGGTDRRRADLLLSQDEYRARAGSRSF